MYIQRCSADGTPCVHAGTAGTSTSHAEERTNDTGHATTHNDPQQRQHRSDERTAKIPDGK